MNRNSAMPSSSIEDLGIPGQNYLSDRLTSCTDPLKAIEEFQVSAIIITYYLHHKKVYFLY